MKALFICKGSTRVGLGHVMRCRTVAAAMERHAEVHVLLVGEARIGRSMLEGRVPSTAVRQDADCVNFANAFQPDVVIFDLLSFDASSFRSLARRSLTVSTSPIFDHLDRVNMVFTRAAVSDRRKDNSLIAGVARGRAAEDRRRRTGPIVRSGYRYVTIGDHCRKVPSAEYDRNLSLDPLSVAISMGGADAPNRTLRILEAVKSVRSPLLIWVLLGEEYAHSYQRLVDCVSDDHRHEIILARTTESMWRVLQGCCVAILAGGITTFEAAYCRIPSLVTLDDASKYPLIAAVVDAGASVYMGETDGVALDRLVTTLEAMEGDRTQLLHMHKRCNDLMVDKNGARRIADEIVAWLDPATQRGHQECVEVGL